MIRVCVSTATILLLDSAAAQPKKAEPVVEGKAVGAAAEVRVCPRSRSALPGRTWQARPRPFTSRGDSQQVRPGRADLLPPHPLLRRQHGGHAVPVPDPGATGL